jgi:glycosyltransferase involved in cell wall biosynthesis
MKRILIMDTGSFKVFGGAAKTAYDTYRYFRRKGYQVDLFGNFSPLDRKVRPKEVNELKADYYDAVLLNSVRDIPVVIGNLRPGNSKTRFIYTDRGNLLNNFKKAGIKKLLPKMIARHYLMLRMRNWLDAYVALTAEQKEYAESFFGKRTKIVFIPNWYSKDFRILKNSKKSESAIYVGRLDERQKKVKFLIRGVKRLVDSYPDLKNRLLLKIVGSGPDELEYKKLVADLNIKKNIRFYSFVELSQLVKLYNESLFFVSTSEWEGMAGTFVEGMACGLPLLINEGNNTLLSSEPKKSLVEDRYNGLIYRYGDLQDFAEKFGILYSDMPLRRRLADNSYKFSKNFEMELNLAKYRKIVEGR